jgi:hypothetical protein
MHDSVPPIHRPEKYQRRSSDKNAHYAHVLDSEFEILNSSFHQDSKSSSHPAA